MNNRNKKIFAGSMAAVLLLGASSLAWFTDRTEGSIDGQAGSLCLEMTDIVGDLEHLAPGDNRELSFEYANLGSLSMDTRVTYALSYELDEDVADVIENDLDVIATLGIDGDELVLTADESMITGTFETGTIKGTNEDVGLDKLTHALNFNFDESVGNVGQKMKFKLDVLVEGKQNRNSPTWEQVHKTTIEFGNQELSVVPVSACNVDNAEEEIVIQFTSPYNENSRYIVEEANKRSVRYYIEVVYRDGERERPVSERIGKTNDVSHIVEKPIALNELIGDRKAEEVEAVMVSMSLDVDDDAFTGCVYTPGVIHEYINLDEYDNNLIELQYYVEDISEC